MVKIQYFQSFNALSDSIYDFEPSPSGDSQQLPQPLKVEPTTIIIFAWGNGHPKHASKYADGYRALMPTSRIIVILCTLVESMIESVDGRTRAMRPVVEAAFNHTEGTTGHDRILVHMMSISGAVSVIATCLAYKDARSNLDERMPELFPHALLVCDSKPGSSSFWINIARWSRALAVASTEWAPLPVLPMQALWCTFLFTVESVSWITGWYQHQVGRLFAEGFQDPNLLSTEAHRLYLYSKNDVMIHWKDIEEHAALAVGKGYRCAMEVFQNSSHVDHMRMYPERYWNAIATAWEV